MLGGGFIYEITISRGIKILHEFGKYAALGGAFPNSRLTLDAAGNLYGTTLAGGICPLLVLRHRQDADLFSSSKRASRLLGPTRCSMRSQGVQRSHALLRKSYSTGQVICSERVFPGSIAGGAPEGCGIGPGLTFDGKGSAYG